MLQGRPVKVLGRPPRAISIPADLEARIASLLAGSWGRASRSHVIGRIDAALLLPAPR